MATLGNGNNVAFIYTRDGMKRLSGAIKASSIEWGRDLCGINRPLVKVAASDCGELNNVHPLAHNLVIYRNGDRVAEGPIRVRNDLAEGGLELTASDVLGLTEKRPNRAARTLTSSAVVTEAVWTINQAFGPDDPNVIAHVQVVGGTGGSVSRDLQVAAGSHYDDLSSLVAAGLRFTTVGRSIVLWADSTVIGYLPTLDPRKHLGVGAGFIEDGDNLATEVTARDDAANVVRVVGPDGAVDPYYGLVGGLVALSSDATTASLTQYARSILGQSYPAPVLIDLPDSATLSCDSPFPIGTLVPGVLAPVETTTATGRKMSGTFVLSNVKVTQAAGADEKVTVSYVPLTSEATE